MPLTVSSLATSSVALIEGYQHPSGAYPACPTYPVYRYSWLRDGAFIADAMSRAGRPDSADAFYGWCAQVTEQRAGRIGDLVRRHRSGEPVEDAQLLPTRYTLDGADDTDPWWNFQLDGYGTWLWTLAAHAGRHGRSLESLRNAVSSTVDYLVAFGDRACFDWWEEHREYRHTSTVTAVVAGLRAAAGMTGPGGGPLLDPDRVRQATTAADELNAAIAADATRTGHLNKWFGADTVDGSLLASLTTFGPALAVAPGSTLAEATYTRVLDTLVAEGVYRYRGDTFYGGGEWVILTAWLGWYEVATGRAEQARSRLDWILAQATPDGLLPEQVSARSQQPEFIPEWTQKWGPVATPLLWSHAMFLTLAVESRAWEPR